jgi:hypothetical protein
MPLTMERGAETGRGEAERSEALKTELENAKAELRAILDECIEKPEGGTYAVKEGAGEKLIENKIEIFGRLGKIRGLSEGNLDDLDLETVKFLNKMQAAVNFLEAESEV